LCRIASFAEQTVAGRESAITAIVTIVKTIKSRSSPTPQVTKVTETHFLPVLDADRPFVGGNFESGYDESLATLKSRFWHVQLKKEF
jgi:hypothetical protein